MSKDRKRKKTHIGIVFLIYMMLLLAGMLFFLRYVNGVLALYEASQPEYAIAAVADSLSANGIGSTATILLGDIRENTPDSLLPYTVAVSGDPSCTVYEDPEEYLAELNAGIRKNGVQYHREREDFSTGAIHYTLYTGEHCFAETSLLPGESETRLKLLTITCWIPQEIRLLWEEPRCSVRVTMPSSGHLQVNGVSVGEENITGSEEISGLEYARQYVEIPDLVCYEIQGLYRVPDVKIYDENGELWAGYPSESGDAAFHMEGDCLTIDLQPEEREMPADLRRFVLDAVETYSLFFSRDLAGAQSSVDPIRPLFPEDSEYLSLAEEYRRNSMGYFDSHSNTHFVCEETDHYIPYGTDCFCCHVYMEKSMTIYGSREVIDRTDGTYCFVRQNDRWVIADIR